jgi:flagellin-like hook-associated protein FlgL
MRKNIKSMTLIATMFLAGLLALPQQGNPQGAALPVTESRAVLKAADIHLSVMTDIFQKIRALAVRASNGTNSAHDRELMELECRELLKECVRLWNTAAWKGTPLFNNRASGWKKSLDVPVGAQTLSVEMPHVSLEDLGVNPAKEDYARCRASLATGESANNTIGVMDEFIMRFARERARLRAFFVRLGFIERLQQSLAALK